jgi:hypothetical protein
MSSAGMSYEQRRRRGEEVMFVVLAVVVPTRSLYCIKRPLRDAMRRSIGEGEPR